jgi:hypothetical protein
LPECSPDAGCTYEGEDDEVCLVHGDGENSESS